MLLMKQRSIFVSLFFILTACEEPAARPAIQVKALNTQAGIQLEVLVPPGHHAYLDAGKEGNLIPVSFRWDGSAPNLTLAPLGEFDEQVRATVLRGRGQWQFEKGAATAVTVRSQICDEKIGLCYPPSETRAMLQRLH